MSGLRVSDRKFLEKHYGKTEKHDGTENTKKI